ncbi:MAG: DUF4397 domain-containing protein [Sphingobacteriales bacterium]|nr:MAG: DUF4397 domain-containing protein [Sphingobacteriales bacterium]
MTLYSRIVLIAVFAVTCLMFQPGCGKSDDESPSSQVMLIHAEPELDNFSVVYNNDQLSQDLSYPAHSDYVSVPGGKEVLFSIQEPDTDSNLLVLRVKTLTAGKYYSMLMVPEPDFTIEAVIFADTIARADTGKVTLRVINASPNSGEINARIIGLATDTTLTNLEFNPAAPSEMSAFLPGLPEGGYEIFFTNSISGDEIYQINDLQFEAGGSYSIILSGYVPSGTVELPPLLAHIISHRP